MTEQAKDIAYLALEIYRSRRDLAGCVNYCLSSKTNKKNGKNNKGPQRHNYSK